MPSGWFIANLDGAPAARNDRSGTWTDFERDERFEDFGINVHVIQPGQANAMYHGEDAQEDFLVLHGECIAVIEDTEHRLRTWDLVHCPRGTRHAFVGAGDGPCAILMVGARRGQSAEYPPSVVAARYGASAADPGDPYAGFPESRPDRFSWPPER